MRNDGLYLEKMTQDYFKKTDGRWYHRLNDSAGSRNLVKAQPSDAICCVDGHSFLLEMKSTKVPKRLPRFVQLPRMKLAALAGMDGYILVHRYLVDVYYVLNIKSLSLEDASYDLSEYPELDWDEAMRKLI